MAAFVGAPAMARSRADKFLNLSPLSSSSLLTSKNFAIDQRICSAKKQNLRRICATPVVRAQNSSIPDYVPDAKFYKIEAILRPWRVPHVSSALLKIGIRGVTISDVRGFGSQGGSKERQAGSEFSEDNFVAKVKMEIVTTKDQVEVVVEKIIEEARTGEIGDGKIFLHPISDVIRVRTGERGEQAERMTGGRSDTSAAGVIHAVHSH
ncbi:nitrogen regulatory P-II-like protein [Wolffia australiana]